MSNYMVGWPFFYLVLVAYWTVLVAELVGDKSIYTVSSLALRFKAPIVATMMLFAFGIKMLVAVLLGGALMRLHSQWVDWLSAGAFFLSAILIWTEEPRDKEVTRDTDTRWWRAAAVCFASLFFTEWGDPGQIAAAALTVKSQSLWAPWLGGTLAMMTKGGLALTVGLTLRDKIPQRALQAVASASCGVLGLIALSGTLFHLRQ